MASLYRHSVRSRILLSRLTRANRFPRNICRRRDQPYIDAARQAHSVTNYPDITNSLIALQISQYVCKHDVSDNATTVLSTKYRGLAFPLLWSTSLRYKLHDPACGHGMRSQCRRGFFTEELTYHMHPRCVSSPLGPLLHLPSSRIVFESPGRDDTAPFPK